MRPRRFKPKNHRMEYLIATGKTRNEALRIQHDEARWRAWVNRAPLRSECVIERMLLGNK
jgi:hypothetical protein